MGFADDSATVGNGAQTLDQPSFRFPLPFDPLRLMAGVFTRWPWIVASMVVFGAVGSLVGIKMTSQSFALSASLIKRRVPETVQASETGQAFRPADLNDATLLATLLANDPLEKATQRAANGIKSVEAKSMVEASQLEGTDIFFITYHSPISAKDAVEFSGIWADEINDYTKRLQQTEAREVRTILQKEVESLDLQISDANREILNFSKKQNFLGGQSQVAAVLGQLSQIELSLEDAKTTVESKKQQIESMIEQIAFQSPIEYQLKMALEELANLRSTYTDQNPLVQSKLQTIEFLEVQVGKLKEVGIEQLEPYTGTPLGNQIYLNIIGLRNELFDAEKKLASLSKMRVSTAARLNEFPAIISEYESLQKKRDSHIEGLSLMRNRLKEAEIFASGAPGYWQIFQEPDSRNVVPSSLVKKPAILGILGSITGAGLSAFLTMLFTQRSSRRSILECCYATRAPLICFLPISLETDAQAAIKDFWLTHVSPQLQRSNPILFWTAALDPHEECRLWTMLAEVILQDTGRPMRVFDLSPDQLWSESVRADSISWHTDCGDMEGLSRPIFTRAASLPRHDMRSHLSQVNHWIAVVCADKSSLKRAMKYRHISNAYLPPCSGTIAWTDKPNGRIREIADLLSNALAKHFSHFPK